MVKVYCQRCVDEFSVPTYEDHPKLCPKCQKEPCPVCGSPIHRMERYCSAKCRSTAWQSENGALLAYRMSVRRAEKKAHGM